MTPRIGLCWMTWALILISSLAAPASAQIRGRADLNADELGPITVVPVPREINNGFLDLQRQLDQGQYPEAIELLQSLLDTPEDYLLGPVIETRWPSSVKQRTVAMLRGLPADARQLYQVQYDPQAAELWRRHQSTAEPTWAAQIIRRYPATGPSENALAYLAARAFDRSEFLTAARWWDDLAAQDSATPYRLERIIAWSATGRSDRAQTLLAELSQSPSGKWRLSGESVPGNGIDQALKQWLAAHLPAVKTPSPQTVADWTMFRGNAIRNAVAMPAGPIGGPAWTLNTLTQQRRVDDPTPKESTPTWNDAVALLEERLSLDEKVKLPGLHPLVVGELAIVRTVEGLTAVDVATGTVRWRTAVPYSQVMPIPEFPGKGSNEDRDRWLAMQAILLRQRLYRDQVTGTLSADANFVYAIEPSPIEDLGESFRGFPTPPTITNKLTAYELLTGKMAWEIGGRRTEAGGSFDGFFFQGPPLVVGDRLYAMAEINSEQRLIELRRTASGVVLEWSQVIAAPQDALGWAYQRRFGGHTPSLAGDVLICPTSAGMVVAVDPVRRMLLWGYRYASHTVPSPAQRFAGFGVQPNHDPRPILDEDEGYWQDSAPTIVGSRVILTPRDSMELHAVDLITGELLWKQPREEGLYVAGVHSDRVIIVGRRSIEARRLDNGEPLWQQPTPPPSGRGLMQAGRYLLPVEAGELLAIDLATGRIAARAKLPAGQSLGNLAAGRGVLVSQTAGTVVGFRSMTVIERQIAAALKDEDLEAEVLGLRGEMRLFQGDEAGGIADLRRSLALRPNRQTSRTLAGVLLDGLKRDFNRYQSLIDEIDRVTVDAELRAEFLELVAEGLEKQGNRVAAFSQYLKLVELDQNPSELHRVDGALTARGDRIIRGRAWATYQAATSAERAEIDRLLRQHLEETADNLDRDRRFLRYFEGHSLADAVRRRAIERLPPDSERLQHLWRLSASRTPSLAAYATAQLVRRHLDQNNFSAARPWLAKLSADYHAESLGPLGDVATLLQRWSMEFANRWDLSPPAWPNGAIEPERRQSVEMSLRRVARFEVVGSLPIDLENWSFELHDEGQLSIVARDAAGRQQWALPLPDELTDVIWRGGPQAAPPRLFAADNLFAISLATAFAVFEQPATLRPPQFLWHRTLAPTDQGPGGGLQLILSEPLASGRRRIYVGDRQREQPYGQVLGLTPNELVYHLGTRVIAVDPLTGQTVWSRNDAPRRAEGTMSAEFVTVFDTDKQQAHVFRSWDGHEVARRDLPNPHDWLWFHGDRLLSIRVRRNELLAEFVELSTGRTVWQQALPLASRSTVVDNRELLVLEPQGQMLALDLFTGQVKWEQMTVAVERLSYLWVQKAGDRYCVVAGNSAMSQPAFGQVRTYDGTQTPFSGMAFQVDPAARTVPWQVEVPATGFEFTQPATAPLLAFVGKVIPPPQQPNGVFPQPAQLTATFIDGRDGTVVYQTTESHDPARFRWELSGEHHRLTADFGSWQLDFTVGDAQP